MVAWIGERVDLDARPGGTFALDFSEVAARGSDTIVNLTHRDLPTDREPSHREGWERCLGVLVPALRQ